jgi:hypothetical protein
MGYNLCKSIDSNNDHSYGETMVSLLRDVCEQEKLLVNMKIQYQFKYKKCLKIFLFLYMYLPVQAQSNPKLSYFEHVGNFSDIFRIQTQVIIIVFIIISIGVNLIGLLTFFDRLNQGRYY